MRKTKLAPAHGHSIRRLATCAAVLAVEVASEITDQLNLSIEMFNMYSRIVFGYIFNTSVCRRITHVSNRLSFIGKLIKPDQWKDVSTDKTPADHATPFPTHQLKEYIWINGPQYLLEQENDNE